MSNDLLTGPTGQMPIVEMNKVYLKSDRGGQIFRDLNFRLVQGRSAIIQGPPGSGKSSLIGLLLGLRKPDTGFVELFGVSVNKCSRHRLNKLRRKIGGVGGMFGLIPSFSVAENISFPMVVTGERSKARKDRLLKMLSEFSLIKQAAEYPHRLTRVERTLVQFARASIASQPLMIIDEPSAGLDSKTFKRIAEFLVKASFSGRSMIIMTSEHINEAIPNTDKYQLKSGELV